uniref:Ferritin n=1 Tax=Acrobeloides nanus TaxID=290746 RepID=A0A914BVC9_9BILA
MSSKLFPILFKNLANLEKIAQRSITSRMNYNKDVENAINSQINKELTAFYKYMAMSAYFDRVEVAFPGAAAFFKKQSTQEWKHAQKLIDFQNNCGGKVILADIKTPKCEWNGLLDAFTDAVEMEKVQKSSLLGLHNEASKAQASDTTTFVDETYLVEQLMEIQQLVRMVNQIKRMGPGLGEQMFDRHLLKEVKKAEK